MHFKLFGKQIVFCAQLSSLFGASKCYRPANNNDKYDTIDNMRFYDMFSWVSFKSRGMNCHNLENPRRSSGV